MFAPVFVGARRLVSSCRERGLFLTARHRLLAAVTSLVMRGLSSCDSQALELGLNSCGLQALVSHGMWNLHGPGIEPMSPALAGGFLSTVPPGKSKTSYHE